jgi:hypothetical protein
MAAISILLKKPTYVTITFMILPLLILIPIFSFASLVIHNETESEVNVIIENNCNPLEAVNAERPIEKHDILSINIEPEITQLCLLLKNAHNHLLSDKITNPNQCNISLSETTTHELELQLQQGCHQESAHTE